MTRCAVTGRGRGREGDTYNRNINDGYCAIDSNKYPRVFHDARARVECYRTFFAPAFRTRRRLSTFDTSPLCQYRGIYTPEMLNYTSRATYRNYKNVHTIRTRVPSARAALRFIPIEIYPLPVLQDFNIPRLGKHRCDLT